MLFPPKVSLLKAFGSWKLVLSFKNLQTAGGGVTAPRRLLQNAIVDRWKQSLAKEKFGAPMLHLQGAHSQCPSEKAITLSLTEFVDLTHQN
eukprot:4452156-Amphidinium_carterae.1